MSTGFTDDACTRTSTPSSGTAGNSISASFITPRFSQTIAFICVSSG